MREIKFRTDDVFMIKVKIVFKKTLKGNHAHYIPGDELEVPLIDIKECRITEGFKEYIYLTPEDYEIIEVIIPNKKK